MKKNVKGIEHVRSRNGFLLILPWIIGVFLFVAIPLCKSIWYALCDVQFDDTGLVTKFNNFEMFRYIFTVDADFTKELTSSISSFLYSLPMILALSLIFAMILNSDFKGRVLARSLFFLPVIIASGVVITLLTTGVNGQPEAMSVTATGAGYSGGMIDYEAVLTQFGFPREIVEFFAKYLEDIFDLIWSIGVQILLFLSGLNSIPKQLYEVSKVEGATKWEEFLFVTIPMLANVIVLVGAYTAIELFIRNDNLVIKHAYDLMQNTVYDRSSAMLWMYFIVIGAICAVIFAIYNKLCLKKWR